MVLNKSIERLPNSAVKLSVSVGKDATKTAYANLLNDYSKKAHIKGFRPGKVPVAVLETKYGESLKLEAAQNLMEETLKTLFAEIEEKPLPYTQPELDGDLNFTPGSDFAFAVKYDVYPTVEIKDYKGLTIEEPQVTIGKEDIDRELDKIQDQNAIVTEIQSGEVKKTDTITCSFVELDDQGQPVAGTERTDFVFTVGKQESVYQFDDEILGAAKDKVVTFSKTYPADFEYSELAGKTVKLQVTVTRIRRKDLPALDDELAQDVDSKFKTLDDLKKDIKHKLEHSAEDRVRRKNTDALLDLIAAKNAFDLPKSMVDAQLYNQYERMVGQLGGNTDTLFQLLAAQGKTPDDMINDWRPGVEKTLRGQIIVQSLVKAEKIEVLPEDLDAEYAHIASHSNSTLEETKKYYEEQKMTDYVEQEVAEKKLFDLILAASTVKKGAKVKFMDLVQK